MNTVPPIASRISAISEGWEFARGRHESGGTSIDARKIEMKFLPAIADLPVTSFCNCYYLINTILGFSTKYMVRNYIHKFLSNTIFILF